MKNTNMIFSTNQTMPGTHVNGTMSSGGNQPPRKRRDVSAHISTIATYSPSMNSRYGVDEYSTANPATSSDSASGRSNGGRLVSASTEMKNTTNIGRSGSQYQSSRLAGRPTLVPSPVLWASTMSVRLS